jgi:RNA polymerase subunit RPABC4/transcription elongation factor Spt4
MGETADVIRCGRCDARVNEEAMGCPECGADPRTGRLPERLRTADVIRCRRCGARVHEATVRCPECGAGPRTGLLPEWSEGEEENTAYRPPGADDREEASVAEVLEALPDALAQWLRRSAHWLVAAVAAGCIVAFVVHDLVAVSAWPSLWRAVGFDFGMIGVILGVMIAYGGRPSLPFPSRRVPSRGSIERIRGTPPRPVAGTCVVLFSLPTIVVLLVV